MASQRNILLRWSCYNASKIFLMVLILMLLALLDNIRKLLIISSLTVLVLDFQTAFFMNEQTMMLNIGPYMA